jgi:TPP-dependent 2-oxoacid decarboxylase
MDGSYNDIRNWDYVAVTRMLKGGDGVTVRTEMELNAAIDIALKSKEAYIIEVVLEERDISSVLKRLTYDLSERV